MTMNIFLKKKACPIKNVLLLEENDLRLHLAVTVQSQLTNKL